MARIVSLQDVKLLKDLRLIAFKCGLRSELTKTSLLSQLQRHARERGPPSQHVRVLSIDMGIKNFSYALLAVPSQADHAERRLPVPAVHAWQNVALQMSSPGHHVDADATTHEGDTAADYSNQAMAMTASHIVNEHLLPLKPTHILIENQRSRSASSASVFEWTLRVNKLEAMLFAILTEKRLQGRWNGQIVSMMPRRIASFCTKDFVNEYDRAVAKEDSTDVGRYAEVVESLRRAEASSKRKGSKEIKKHKIDMVGSMLELGDRLDFPAAETREKAEAFLRQWINAKAGRKKRSSEDEKTIKLDDLADSLLQALTWLKWESNRDILASGDISPLLEPHAPLDDTDGQSSPSSKIPKGRRRKATVDGSMPTSAKL